MSDAHFFLHHHPCQRALARVLSSKLAQEGRGQVFYQSQVIVRNHVMAPWLRQQLAEPPAEIAMQVEFPQPNRFLQSLVEFPSVTVETLLWRTYATLPRVKERAGFSLVKDYLDGPGGSADLKRYQLAARIAGLFDKYLLYRPDWIRAWNAGEIAFAGEHEQWQQQLWIEIDGPSLQHWAQHIQELNRSIPQERLPEAVHVFGISTFAPAYINFLYDLSKRTTVHIYWLNPVDGYWGDAPSKRQWILEQAYEEEVDPFSHNPLLVSNGQMGREFVHNIYGGQQEEFLVQEQELFTADAPPPESQLEWLQEGIRTNLAAPSQLLASGAGGDAPAPVPPLDRSISIHACHSPTREVQTLKDYLLTLATEQPLDTGEILVMCTDIKAYAPAIEAVFGSHNQDTDRPLPYRIADRDSLIHHPTIAAVAQLFTLRSSRFTSKEALDLLQTPAIQERFGITSEALDLINHWVTDNGIRWGFSHDHVQQAVGEMPDSPWTWEAGLDRMLLGAMLPAADATPPLWRGIAPYTELEGDDLAVLSALCDFIQWCKRIYTDLAHDRTMDQWVEQTRLWIAQGLAPEEETGQWELRALFSTLDTLFEAAADSQERLPHTVFGEHLRDHLSTEPTPTGFLTGRITFCEMKPMRSIPIETICILGMSHDAFPRRGQDLQFDLTREERRPGDRAARNDDLYLFLETLISAKKQLFISYIGMSITDGSELPPSTTLQTLLDHTPGLTVQRERLHAFDQSYFMGETPQSFSPQLCAAAQSLQEDLTPPAPVNFALDHAATPERTQLISLESFIAALTSPCKYFYKNVLQAAAYHERATLQEDEPVEVDNLERWGIRNGLLHTYDPEQLIAPLTQRGALPPAALGLQLWEENNEMITPLREQLPPVQLQQVSIPLDAHHRLVGAIPVTTPPLAPTIISSTVSSSIGTYLLRMRIQQLVLSAALGHPVSAELHYLVKQGADHHPTVETLLPDPHYAQQLTVFLTLYHQAQQSPLPHFPKTAYAYWSHTPKPKKKDAAELTPEDADRQRQSKAQSVWDTSFTGAPGESEDAFISTFYPIDSPCTPSFLDLTSKIWPPLLAQLATDEE